MRLIALAAIASFSISASGCAPAVIAAAAAPPVAGITIGAVSGASEHQTGTHGSVKRRAAIGGLVGLALDAVVAAALIYQVTHLGYYDTSCPTCN